MIRKADTVLGFVFCAEASEDIHHLLLHCKFAQKVWLHILQQLSLSFHWTGASFPECFATWTFDLAAPPSLAVYVSWHLWNERNKTLFEDILPSYRTVCYRILSSFHWQLSSIKLILHKVVDLSLPAGHTVAFFDGAAKSTGCCCGAGGIFKTHPERTTKWFLCCGRGSNTKAELLDLWATLLLASYWSLDHIQVFGDSKVIIDWINNKCDLHSSHVEGWKSKTQLLASSFSDISFRHLPRTFNSEADALSKRALRHEAGRLYIFHCDRGQSSSTTYLNLFET